MKRIDASRSRTPQLSACVHLDRVQRHEGVWICRGIDIARHWRDRHPPVG